MTSKISVFNVLSKMTPIVLFGSQDTQPVGIIYKNHVYYLIIKF